jgi:Domain of unknown function (DUF4345)
MKTLQFTLKLLAPVFYVVAALHLVFGLNADGMLGATVPAELASEPSLSSQNRFYGVAFALYGVVLHICARDLKANEALFKAAMSVFFLAGAARLVPWVQYGAPAPLVLILLLSELLGPVVLLVWYTKAKSAA